MQKKLAVLIALALAAAPFAASGADCHDNVKGTYSVGCQGYIGTPSGFVPFAAVGVQSSDKDGSFSGLSNVSIGGQQLVQFTEGPPRLNDDCISGTITYDVWLVTSQGNVRATPPTESFAFVVLDHGDLIRSIATSEGTTISCLLERISPVSAR